MSLTLISVSVLLILDAEFKATLKSIKRCFRREAAQ